MWRENDPSMLLGRYVNHSLLKLLPPPEFLFAPISDILFCRKVTKAIL